MTLLALGPGSMIPGESKRSDSLFFSRSIELMRPICVSSKSEESDTLDSDWGWSRWTGRIQDYQALSLKIQSVNTSSACSLIICSCRWHLPSATSCNSIYKKKHHSETQRGRNPEKALPDSPHLKDFWCPKWGEWKRTWKEEKCVRMNPGGPAGVFS